jgi:hypothetical protein
MKDTSAGVGGGAHAYGRPSTHHSRGSGPSPRDVGEAILCVGSWFFGPESGVLTCAAVGVSHLPN